MAPLLSNLTDLTMTFDRLDRYFYPHKVYSALRKTLFRVLANAVAETEGGRPGPFTQCPAV